MIKAIKSILPQGLYAFLRDSYVFLDRLIKRTICFFVGFSVRQNQDVRYSWELGSGCKFVVRQRYDEPYFFHKYIGGFDCYETYRKAVETFAPKTHRVTSRPSTSVLTKPRQ